MNTAQIEETADTVPISPPPYIKRGNLRSLATKWIVSHKEAMAECEAIALEMAANKKKFGMKFLAEVLRWQGRFQSLPGELRINNNFSSYIARELINRHPHLVDFMKFRKVRY